MFLVQSLAVVMPSGRGAIKLAISQLLVPVRSKQEFSQVQHLACGADHHRWKGERNTVIESRGQE